MAGQTAPPSKKRGHPASEIIIPNPSIKARRTRFFLTGASAVPKDSDSQCPKAVWPGLHIAFRPFSPPTAKLQAVFCRVFYVFACSLTLLASGDDINVMRLLQGNPLVVYESPLPLDNPNTDFLETAASKTNDCQDNYRTVVSQFLFAATSANRDFLNPTKTWNADPPFSCAPLLTPMRC